MTSCKVCGKKVRKTSVVMILRKGGLKGARVCQECVTQLGVTIVVAREVPHCKCGKPATKCHVCAGAKTTSTLKAGVETLKGRLKAAKLTPTDPMDSVATMHHQGRIEGLESAIELLEGGRF